MLFTADANSSEPTGPYAVPLDASAPARRLTRLPGDGDLSSELEGPRFAISADSSRVAFRAFLSTATRVNELFLSLLSRAPLPSGPPE